MKRSTKNKSSKQTPSVDTQATLPENGCLVINHKDLREQLDIGSGFYADVKFGIWTFKTKNQHVAIKCLKEEVRKDLNILEEASNMSKLKNDHIIKFYGICGVDRDVKLVMEYARYGSLKKVMKDPEQRKFFCQHIRLKDFAVQVSLGMEYLADKALVQCNLGARDVLVVDTDLVRIRCDVTIANALGQSQPWCAPEVIQHQRHTIKSDVYSFGVVLWEMMTFGEDIGKNKVLACQNRNSNDIPDRPRSCPTSMYELMHACLSEKPDDRPGFDEITSSLAKIVYQVGSSTFKVITNKSGYLSFNINSRMTVIERVDDTDWLAQNEDADVGIVREDHVNLRIKPQERSLPAQISSPFDPVKLPSCSWEISKDRLKDMSRCAEEDKKTFRMPVLKDTNNTPDASKIAASAESKTSSPGNLEINEEAGVSSVSEPMQSIKNNSPSISSAPPIPPRHDLAPLSTLSLARSRPIPTPRKKKSSCSEFIPGTPNTGHSHGGGRPRSEPLFNLDNSYFQLEKSSEITVKYSSSENTGTAPKMDEKQRTDQLKDVSGDQNPPLIDFLAELQVTDTLKPGDRPNREESCGNITGKDHSSKEVKAAQGINHADHIDVLQKENCKQGDEDTPLIDFFTSVMPSNSDQQGGRTRNEAAYPLIDLSEENAMEASSPHPCITLQSTTLSNEHNSIENTHKELFAYDEMPPPDSNYNTNPFSTNQRPLQGFQSTGQSVCKSPDQTPYKGKENCIDSHEQDEREQIYQKPFHIPIPSYMPHVDPERLRQPPPTRNQSPAYGRETDASIARLQEEFGLSRDECYARLLHYNHDIERIIKILKVKNLADVDEDSARFHLGHCGWDVERTVNYIFSKTE